MSGTLCCIFLTPWTTPHFPAAMFPTTILFFLTESDLRGRKDPRKAVHLLLQRWKQEHVVSSHDTAYLRDKVLRVTLQARGVRVTLKCGVREKGVHPPDIILSSLPRESVVMVQKCLGVPWKRRTRETRELMRKVVQNVKGPTWTQWDCPRSAEHRFDVQNCSRSESALYLRSSHKVVRETARNRAKGVQIPEVILFSQPRETVSMVQKILEVSQTRLPRESESTCKKSFKMWRTDLETMRLSQKCRWTPRRCTSRYGRYLRLHRCRQHYTWIRIARRIWKYSRIPNLKTLKVCFNVTNMMIAGNSEMKNIFPKDSANPSWKRSTLPIDQAIEWTKARPYVYSDSVLCLGKTLGPGDAVKKMGRTSVNFTGCYIFSENC